MNPYDPAGWKQHVETDEDRERMGREAQQADLPHYRGPDNDMRYYASQRDRSVKRSISPFQKVCGVIGFVLLMALGYVVICLVLGSGQ